MDEQLREVFDGIRKYTTQLEYLRELVVVALEKGRIPMDNIDAVITARKKIELDDGESFYLTSTAVEVWQDDPLKRLKRIPRDKIEWVSRK